MTGKVISRRYLGFLILLIGLIFIPYSNREEFILLPFAYLTAFLGFSLIYFFDKNELKASEILIMALVSRLIFIPYYPNLSDDFFRFIWDGRVSLAGINPYLFRPVELLDRPEVIHGIGQDLFDNLNSQTYYSVYPPISQWLYSIAAMLGKESLLSSVIALRSILILFDLGLIYLLIKLCRHYGIDVRNTMIYALNPLIIIELSGNLHGEGVMLFFFMASIILLKRKAGTIYIMLSALMMAGAIATKLLPLMFLPIMIFVFDWKHALAWLFWIGILVLLFTLPYYNSALITNYSESIDLFLRKFEFNASVYNLINSILSDFKGYNTIGLIGPLLKVVTIISVVILAILFNKRSFNLFDILSCALLVHFLMSSTVHPWYLSTLLLFAVFSKYRFALLWSLTVILSYHMYSNQLIEKPILLWVEYIVVVALAIYEFKTYGFRSKKILLWGETQ